MNLSPVLRQRYFDANGNPLAGGKLYSYQAGTTTPQATYTDSSGSTANANPVVLDANGEASMWLDPELSYKFILTDSDDNQQWSVDNVVGLLATGAVVTGSIADEAVTTAKLDDDAVTSDKLSSSADTDGDRAVTTDHIRDSAITGVKLNSNVVDDSTLEISSNQLAVKDSGITAAKIAADFYQTETKTLDNDFSSGAVTMTRIGNVVTISFTTEPVHDAGTASTSAGFIPEDYRPSVGVMSSAKEWAWLSISTTGMLTLDYRTFVPAGPAFATDTGKTGFALEAATISYTVSS